MQLTSPAFGQNDRLPQKYTCDGARNNPPLEIKEAPTGTQSMTLIMDDPDASMGTFDHWIAFNIPPETATIAEGQMRPGTMGRNTAGESNYMPPCPPRGEHHYVFKLYALDVKLNLQPGASKQEIERAMQGHILEQAELIGLYSR